MSLVVFALRASAQRPPNDLFQNAIPLAGPGKEPADDWIEYESGNVTLAVMTPHTHDYEFTPLPPGTIALRVPDVAAARAELEAKGVAFDGETLDTGVCHFAFFRDPDGNQLMLHRRYAPR